MTARKTPGLPVQRGSAPASQLKRLVDIAGAVASILVREHGPTELIHRLSDPFWFQAFASVLGINPQTSSATSSVCTALKEAARKHGRDLGIVVCGGKGATSKKAPEEIRRACDRTGDQAEPLIYASRLAAKVDSDCLQDGFDLYHHTFIFVPGCGAWALVQQGMSPGRKYLRRYHWNSMRLRSFVPEPHTAVACERRVSALNLVAAEADRHRQAITALTREHPDRVVREVQAFLHGPPQPHFNGNGHARNGKKTSSAEARSSSRRLRDLNAATIRKVLSRTYASQACDFEELLGDPGVGAESLRSLSLLAEVIYQAPASRRDPALYSFVHGHKEGNPYPANRAFYDRHLDRLRSAVDVSRLADNDKTRALRSLGEFVARLEK